MDDPPFPSRPSQVAKKDDCLSRTLYGTTVSSFFGATLGALRSNWQEMSRQEASKVSTAMAKTGGAMLTYGIFLGGVGLLYCGTECLVEKFRQREDLWNGFSGGLAAGLAVGMKTKSLSVGVGSGFAMGALSMLVDATGHSLKGESLIPDDGSMPSRKDYRPAARIDG